MDFDDLEDAPVSKDGPGWAGKLEGFCPVQGDGRVDGVFWYFRARWDAWTFEVFSESCADNLPDSAPLAFFQGDYDNASWMKWSDAWNIIEEQIATWRSVADKETR